MLNLNIRESLRKRLLREDVDHDLYDMRSNLMHELMGSYLDDLEKEKPEKAFTLQARQPWRTFPIEPVKRVWGEYMKFGYVPERFHKIIYKLEELITENILKLDINTELAGHASNDPIEEWRGYLEGMIPEDKIETYLGYIDKHFGSWIEDDRGQYRISDYGLGPLFKHLAALRASKTVEEKLQHIDHIFEVVHMRGDIAALFITGGSDALSALSGYEREELNELGARLNQVARNNSFIGRLWDNHGERITALLDDMSERNPNLHKSTLIDVLCKILQSLDL